MNCRTNKRLLAVARGWAQRGGSRQFLVPSATHRISFFDGKQAGAGGPRLDRGDPQCRVN
jgi:hypothetical protein